MIQDTLDNLFADEALPWSDGDEWEIDDFLIAYTLHDSNWSGLQLDVAGDGSATAEIDFDPIWNHFGVKAGEVAEHFTLFIRFTGTSQFSIDGYADTGRFSRCISDVALTKVDGGLVETAISDIFGGRLILRHAPRIITLCYSERGDLIGLKQRFDERTAAPHGGPATSTGNSGVMEGPPSLS